MLSAKPGNAPSRAVISPGPSEHPCIPAVCCSDPFCPSPVLPQALGGRFAWCKAGVGPSATCQGEAAGPGCGLLSLMLGLGALLAVRALRMICECAEEYCGARESQPPAAAM